MLKNKELVLFDFCDTIVKGQSEELFSNFLNKKRGLFSYLTYRILLKYYAITNKKDLLSRKLFKLKHFVGAEKEFFQRNSQEFVANILENRLNKVVFKILKSHIKNDSRVIIISGGYSIYINEFIKYLDLNVEVIGTELEFINNKFTGKIINNQECLSEVKLKLLKDKLEDDWYSIDFKNSYAYSDHKSDIPLLNIVGNSYIIHFGQDISWKKKDWNVIELETLK